MPDNKDNSGKNKDAKEAIVGNLLDAIDLVRSDVTKVELWAFALTGFSRPVPDYDPGKMTVWLPSEQASKLQN